MGYKLAIISLMTVQAFTATALPPCVCTRNLQPVCGSDGHTYSNPCILECEKHKTGKSITIKKEGPCEGIKPAVCICTLEFKPVCGSDGITYPNRCELLCKRLSLPDIDVVSEGACRNTVKVAEVACNCPDVIEEVCGSDGNTYENSCRLNCATAKNPSLSIKSFTKCDNSIHIAGPLVPRPPPCICTAQLYEVCGSDGVTYDNPCLLNCATANNPSLSVKNYGKCEDVNPIKPKCVCPRNLKPVCGSDGITYSNECLLRCAGSSLAKNAPC